MANTVQWINNETRIVSNTVCDMSSKASQVWLMLSEINSIYHSSDWIGTKRLYLFYRDRLIRWRTQAGAECDSLFNELKALLSRYTFLEMHAQLMFHFLYGYIALSAYISTRKSDYLRQAQSIFTILIEKELPELLESKAPHSTTMYRKLNVLTYHCRAVVYSMLNNYELELSDNMKAIDFEPNFAATYHNLGMLMYNPAYKHRNIQKALYYFSCCVYYDPSKKESFMSISKLYADMGQFSNAIDSCQKALRIDPHYSIALQSLGTLYSHLGDYDSSVRCYLRALDGKSSSVEHVQYLTQNARQAFEQMQLASSRKQLSITSVLPSPTNS